VDMEVHMEVHMVEMEVMEGKAGIVGEEPGEEMVDIIRAVVECSPKHNHKDDLKPRLVDNHQGQWVV